MQQILNIWAGLDTRKRLMAIGGTVAVILTVFAMSQVAQKPTMQLLYAGLESSSAGDVVASLEQSGVNYEVRGGSIYVPSTQRDELRMTLASQGLPANGGKGYELLDRSQVSEQHRKCLMPPIGVPKKANWREPLWPARMSARHAYVSPIPAPALQRTMEPTASVSVTPMGTPITATQANAVRFLVASAVTGLSVDNVA